MSYSLHVPDASEMQDMRNPVEGKPDHPDRKLLETYEHRITGEDTERFSAWIISDTRWRFEQTDAGGRVIRAYGRDGDIAWDASGLRLVVVDRNRAFPASAESLFSVHSDLLPLKYFVYQAAGLNSMRRPEGAEVALSPTGADATLSWLNESAGKRWEVQVSIDDRDPRLSADWYRSDDGARENVFTFTDRRPFDGIERPLTATVDWIDSELVHSRTYELLDVRRIDPSTFPGLDVPEVDELPSLPEGWPAADLNPIVQDHRAGNLDQLPESTVVVVDADADSKQDRYREIRRGNPPPSWGSWRLPAMILGLGAVAAGVLLVRRKALNA